MRALGNLLRLFSLRYYARHRLRTALGFGAIALAVALYVASASANAGIVASAERAYEDDDSIVYRVRPAAGAPTP